MRKAVDNLCLYDPDFEGYAQRTLNEWGGSSDIFPITSKNDLDSAVKNFSNIKFLEVVLHGTPGKIQFYKDGKLNGEIIGEYLGTAALGLPFMQPNGRILFDSCSIGSGVAGDSFMDKLGERLFMGKGGIIGATTVANSVVFPKLSFGRGVQMASNDGRLKVYKYDIKGVRVNEMIVDSKGNRY